MSPEPDKQKLLERIRISAGRPNIRGYPLSPEVLIKELGKAESFDRLKMKYSFLEPEDVLASQLYLQNRAGPRGDDRRLKPFLVGLFIMLGIAALWLGRFMLRSSFMEDTGEYGIVKTKLLRWEYTKNPSEKWPKSKYIDIYAEGANLPFRINYTEYKKIFDMDHFQESAVRGADLSVFVRRDEAGNLRILKYPWPHFPARGIAINGKAVITHLEMRGVSLKRGKILGYAITGTGILVCALGVFLLFAKTPGSGLKGSIIT